MIKKDLVIKCLKYVANHKDASYEEIVKGLDKLGWIYSCLDVNSFMAPTHPLLSGILEGDLYTGAYILGACVTNSLSWSAVQDGLLKYDGDFSIYQYIRAATGDDSYTMPSDQYINDNSCNHERKN